MTPVILTRPSCVGPTDFAGLKARAVAAARLTARRARDSVRHRQAPWLYWGGHSAVTESLVMGLRESGVDVPLDPLVMPAAAPERIGVLAGVSTLTWAVRYAERRRNVRLSVGPNVVVSPLEEKQALESPCVDQIIVPSGYVGEYYANALPSIAGKIRVWMAGVDTDYWQPTSPDHASGARPLSVLLYVKTKDRALVEQTWAVCDSMNMRITAVKYGFYSRRQFLRALQASDVMVVLGGSESQGLAMFEAWSTGVPTLVWQGVEPLSLPIPGRAATSLTVPANASPYLTAETGRFWSTTAELRALLDGYRSEEYSARSWVLAHARRQQSARDYLELLNER